MIGQRIDDFAQPNLVLYCNKQLDDLERGELVKQISVNMTFGCMTTYVYVFRAEPIWGERKDRRDAIGEAFEYWSDECADIDTHF